MKIDKISPQIAALYLGQKCEYPDDNGGKIVCFLTGVASDGIETTYKKKRAGICGDLLAWNPNSPTQKRFAGNVILHLRSLDSITEDEARECFKLYFDATIEDETYKKSGKEWFYAMFESGSMYAKFPAHIFLHLLSKGFDLFNLIDNGLAKDINRS